MSLDEASLAQGSKNGIKPTFLEASRGKVEALQTDSSFHSPEKASWLRSHWDRSPGNGSRSYFQCGHCFLLRHFLPNKRLPLREVISAQTRPGRAGFLPWALPGREKDQGMGPWRG